MKRKTRTQPSNPFYSSEPAVARSKIASNAMVPNANLAGGANKTTDKHPGRLSGIAGFASKSKPGATPAVSSIPKLGSPAKVPQQGSLKSSGHPSAHRIGLKLPKSK